MIIFPFDRFIILIYFLTKISIKSIINISQISFMIKSNISFAKNKEFVSFHI